MDAPFHLLVKTPPISDIASVEHRYQWLKCTVPYHDKLMGVKDSLAQIGSHFYLRVKNEKGVWELQKIEGTYKLRPKILERVEREREERKEEEEGQIKQVMRQSLVNEFGTKKQKKKMAVYFESQNDAKNVSTGKELERILTKTKERQAKQEAKEEEALGLKEKNSKRALLPSYSQAAETVEELYDLHSIISPEEMDVLSPKEFETLLKKPTVLPKIHSYVKILTKQLETKHNQLSKREAQMLLYLSHLLMLYEMKREIRGEVGQIAERWKIPQIIVKNMLEKFTETGVDLKSKKVKFVKGSEQQHKLVHYIIVLALFILDFELDPTPLAKALALKFKTLRIYLERTFCKPVHQLSKKVEDSFSQYTVAKLMLPPSK